ncbi:hypothetical protein [Salisaeta longa]|uniref:hypothetical protein n=1 Tax=Salisaeta longa TaxID=503170 RepID=UPI0003B69566|nr:hypothetical protein [Salisaeta longa]
MAVSDIQQVLTLLQRDAIEEAIAQLQAKVDEMPAHLTAHVLLAQAYESTKQWRLALRAWEQAYFLMPTSPVIARGRRRTLDQLGDTPIEEHQLRKASVRHYAQQAADDESDAREDPPTDEFETDAPEGPPTDEFQAPGAANGTADADAPQTLYDARLDPADAQAADDEAGSEEPEAGDSADDPLSGPAEGGLEDLRAQADAEARRTSEPQRTLEALEEELPDAPRYDVGTDDLDRLIEELEAARITPNPDLKDLPEPDLTDTSDDLVSETLARIYAAQGQFQEAARIYVKLASQEPGRAREHLEQAATMRERAENDEADA